MRTRVKLCLGFLLITGVVAVSAYLLCIVEVFMIYCIIGVPVYASLDAHYQNEEKKSHELTLEVNKAYRKKVTQERLDQQERLDKQERLKNLFLNNIDKHIQDQNYLNKLIDQCKTIPNYIQSNDSDNEIKSLEHELIIFNCRMILSYSLWTLIKELSKDEDEYANLSQADVKELNANLEGWQNLKEKTIDRTMCLVDRTKSVDDYKDYGLIQLNLIVKLQEVIDQLFDMINKNPDDKTLRKQIAEEAEQDCIKLLDPHRPQMLFLKNLCDDKQLKTFDNNLSQINKFKLLLNQLKADEIDVDKLELKFIELRDVLTKKTPSSFETQNIKNPSSNDELSNELAYIIRIIIGNNSSLSIDETDNF